MSQECVRIASTVAALNNLEGLLGDIGNANLNADCCEKVYTIAVPKFGLHGGNKLFSLELVWCEYLRCYTGSTF
jgi:hypothetical protein